MAGLPGKAPARGARQPILLWFVGILVAGVVLLILFYARFFLIPLALAILLFSLTSSIIDLVATRFRFGSARIPNWLASVVAVLMIATILLALFGIVSAQINTVIVTASGYAERSQEAVAALFAWFGEDVANAVLAAFRDIDVGAYLRAFAGSAGNLLTGTILVILYIGFLFAERPNFSTKLYLLFREPGRAEEVARVFAAISSSVHRYLLVKSAVSMATALIVYGVLLLFGLDFAEALASLTFVLNFIPNIGSIVATALPALVALVQFGDLPSVMMVLVVVGAVQFGIGNVLDPMLMGRALSLSSFAIILSLTFWGAVWGVAGLFLAVPIMVMVMIVCSHIPSLRKVAILLSRDGVPYAKTVQEPDPDKLSPARRRIRRG